MNYVSPLLNRNVSSKNSVVPASVGRQVPNNPQDLMNQLRSFERRASRSDAPRRGNNASTRKLQQELRSEMIERVLMQNEDAARFFDRKITSPTDETLRMY